MSEMIFSLDRPKSYLAHAGYGTVSSAGTWSKRSSHATFKHANALIWGRLLLLLPLQPGGPRRFVIWVRKGHGKPKSFVPTCSIFLGSMAHVHPRGDSLMGRYTRTVLPLTLARQKTTATGLSARNPASS
ncbi:hypothetical protein CLAIMM_10281 [Cladophialophora immunda]|nr:hypothetical protein CLAIMM_10281 [Cladophialophora immunda]